MFKYDNAGDVGKCLDMYNEHKNIGMLKDA
jgi:hypothetical protein